MDFVTLTLELAQNQHTMKSINSVDSNTRYVVSATEVPDLGEFCDLNERMVSNQDYMGFSDSRKLTMKYFQENMCTVKYLFDADY